MSTMAPEAPPAAPAPSARGRAGGGNVFTRKIGPLPMWVWLLIGLGLIGAYVYWKRNQAAQQAQPTANASQVPQFVNQVYTNQVPPTAPQPGTTPTCPEGFAWDPDSQKCIPERGKKKRRTHKGRNAPAVTGGTTSGGAAWFGPVPGTVSGTGVTSINPGTAPGGGPSGPAVGLPPNFFPQYVPPTGG